VGTGYINIHSTGEGLVYIWLDWKTLHSRLCIQADVADPGLCYVRVGLSISAMQPPSYQGHFALGKVMLVGTRPGTSCTFENIEIHESSVTSTIFEFTKRFKF
jgi:hypothetical protein